MSFSNSDSRVGKSNAPNKIKPLTNCVSDSSYILVTSKKKNTLKSNTDSLIPTFPEFQHIINNTPILNTSLRG